MVYIMGCSGGNEAGCNGCKGCKGCKVWGSGVYKGMVIRQAVSSGVMH